jgi:hypothetical protein
MPSQELRDHMNEWAKKHNIGCPLAACGALNWQTGELINCQGTSDGRAVSTRMVQVFCGVCGYVLLFNADIVGVKDDACR